MGWKCMDKGWITKIPSFLMSVPHFHYAKSDPFMCLLKLNFLQRLSEMEDSDSNHTWLNKSVFSIKTNCQIVCCMTMGEIHHGLISTLHSSVLIKILPPFGIYSTIFPASTAYSTTSRRRCTIWEKNPGFALQKIIKIWGVLTLLFCSSENIYSVREKEEGDMFILRQFISAVHCT